VAHPKVVLDGGDDHARVDREPAGNRGVDQQQNDRLEDLDDRILRAAVEVVDHHAQPQRPLAAKLLVVVLHGAQQVVQVLHLHLDLAHETEALRHVGAS
jgi:methylmalonyl-CoA mutase N-terminal domain/subunit